MASKVKQTILAVAIAIVLALFVGFGINTFYRGVDYDDFCDRPVPGEQLETQEECEAQGGKWIPHVGKCPEGQECREGWCEPDFACRQEWEEARGAYNKNVFIIATIAGLIAVFLGGVVLKLESVSSGIMGGGVLSVIYGIIRYWSDAPDILRFIILGVILAVLIWIGYKKLSAK
jgi:hypothetical protein